MMAIPANAVVDYFGTQNDLDGTSLAVVNGAFSVAGDLIQWTNSDDISSAVFTLRGQFATLPTDGAEINLFARQMDVQGTNDSPVPSDANLSQYIGAVVVDGDVAVNTDAFLTSYWLPLQNHSSAQVYEFYIQNNSGQSLAAGWSLFITTATKGPKV